MTHIHPATLDKSSPHELYENAIAAHGPALVRLARSYEADPDRRQDLLQEIHFALWRSFASYDGRCSMRTWTYRVAHNVATSHVLRHRRRGARDLLSLDALEVTSYAVDGEQVAGQRIDQEWLHSLLRRLKPFDRQLMLLVGSVVVAVTSDGGLMRLGAVMMAFLFAFVLMMLYRTSGVRDVTTSAALPSLESYRADLERHRKLFTGFRLWSRPLFALPVAIVFSIGLARAHPALARNIYLDLVAIVVGLSITCVIAYRKGRQYQQEIDELDALRR